MSQSVEVEGMTTNWVGMSSHDECMETSAFLHSVSRENQQKLVCIQCKSVESNSAISQCLSPLLKASSCQFYFFWLYFLQINKAPYKLFFKFHHFFLYLFLSFSNEYDRNKFHFASSNSQAFHGKVSLIWKLTPSLECHHFQAWLPC